MTLAGCPLRGFLAYSIATDAVCLALLTTSSLFITASAIQCFSGNFDQPGACGTVCATVILINVLMYVSTSMPWLVLLLKHPGGQLMPI